MSLYNINVATKRKFNQYNYCSKFIFNDLQTLLKKQNQKLDSTKN